MKNNQNSQSVSSRVLKFRAWHNRYKEMMIVDELNHISSRSNKWILWVNGVNCTIGIQWGDHNDCIVMQWSGLLDKNGREIYEGDIVRKQVDIKYTNIWPWACKQEPIYRNYLYKWEWMWFVSKSLSPEPKYYESWADHNNKEIIGNIYETPELLNPEQVG